MIVNKYRIELVKESGTQYQEYNRKLDGPDEVARLLFDMGLDRGAVESMYLILLDTRLRLIGLVRLATGTCNTAMLDIRGMIQAALMANAVNVMLAHNHPSGDSTPSGADIEATRRAQDACATVGVKLLEHIILGHDGRYTSLYKEHCMCVV